MSAHRRRFVTAHLWCKQLWYDLAVLWEGFKLTHPKLIRRTVRALKIMAISVAMVLASFLFIGIQITAHRTDTGTINYPRPHSDIVQVNFSCGAQTPSNPWSGDAIAMFHGQPLDMHGIPVNGMLRPQVGTTTSDYDMEAAGTRPHAKRITQDGIRRICRRYYLVDSTRELEIWVGWCTFWAIVTLCVFASWRRHWRKMVALAVIFMAVLNLCWFGSLEAENLQVQAGISHVHKPTDLFSFSALGTDPPQVGPARPGVEVISSGDSVESGYNSGAQVLRPTPEDITCERSASDIAAQMREMFGVEVWDTSCPGSDMEPGILTPEYRRGQRVTPQVSYIKAATNARVVIMHFGPNALGWGALLALAVQSQANIPAVPIAVNAAIDHERPLVNNFLSIIRTLNKHRRVKLHVVIMGTYYPFQIGLHCADTDGVTVPEMSEIYNAVTQLNNYEASLEQDNPDLVTFVPVRLKALCSPQIPGTPNWGPEIVGHTDIKHFMHPTPLGEKVLAEELEPTVSRYLPPGTGFLQPPAPSQSPNQQAFAGSSKS